MTNGYWDTPQAEPVSAAATPDINGVTDEERRLIERDAGDIVMRKGNLNDLALRHPQVSRQYLQQQLDSASVRQDWNAMDNTPGQYSNVQGQSEAELDREQGEERMLGVNQNARTRGGLGGLARKLSEMGSSLKSGAQSTVSYVQDKLGIGTENAKLAYAEDMGPPTGDNVDRMLQQGTALNAGLPGRQPSRGLDAGIGRA